MSFWQRLNKRERFLVGVCLPIVAVVIFYLYFWQPTEEELVRLRLTVPEKVATLAWMEHRLQNANPTKKTQSSSNEPLLTTVEKVAIVVNVKNAIQRVQPGKNNSIEIWFNEAVADHIFAFVDRLAQDKITVASATISRSTPGLVTARIKLERP